jgi:hypothetical protein
VLSGGYMLFHYKALKIKKKLVTQNLENAVFQSITNPLTANGEVLQGYKLEKSNPFFLYKSLKTKEKMGCFLPTEVAI